ncbi:hypothetical protein [Cellulosimicrobium sp. Marseille-Q8652]
MPAGSTTLNPAAPPAFARRRGRVMRGTPVSGSRPYRARSPVANVSNTGAVSSTTAMHVLYESSGATPTSPK